MILSMPWPWRRTVNFARMCSTVGMTSGPTLSIIDVRMPLQQRHHRRHPIDGFALSWCLHEVDDRNLLVVAEALDHSLDRLAQHLSNDCRVQFGRVDDLGDLVIEVAAQPRHCGELHPVGFLMQANPEPEVRRIDIELTLDGNDVRRDEQQSAAS